jgi:hypothetical protein
MLFSPKYTQTEELKSSRPEFVSAMDNAWKAAMNLTTRTHNSPKAGCWRLIDSDVASLGYGDSAGGAAALGWYHLLQGTNPDKEIIVMTSIDEQGNLGKVAGIPEKITAVVDSGLFDTVVVASQENLKEANNKLKELGASDKIIVGLPEDLIKYK